MRKYQVRFRGGITEKELCYLAGILPDTSDGRKLGLDQRLINPLLPDDPNSKVNTCVKNVYSAIYQRPSPAHLPDQQKLLPRLALTS